MTDIDEELAALYRAARAQEAPTPADRRAVRVAVTTALAASAVTTSAHAAGGLAASQAVKGLAVGKLALWLSGGAAIGVTLASTAWLVTSRAESTGPSSALAISATRSATAPASPAHAAAAVSAAQEPSSPAPPAAVPDRSPRRALSGPPVVEAAAEDAASPSPTRPSLLVESDGVQRIQQALARGEAAHALKLLAEQDAQFRGGALAEERAALRVLALCASGQVDAAEAARQRFFGAYPHSPHAARVRDNCPR